jgi:hypothetical protein
MLGVDYASKSLEGPNLAPSALIILFEYRSPHPTARTLSPSQVSRKRDRRRIATPTRKTLAVPANDPIPVIGKDHGIHDAF